MSLLLENGRHCGDRRPDNPKPLDFYIEPPPDSRIWVYAPIRLSTIEKLAYAFAGEEPPEGDDAPCEWVVFGK